MATKSNKKTSKKVSPAANARANKSGKKPAARKAVAAPAKPKPKITISKRPTLLKRLARGGGERVSAAGLYTWNKWLAVLFALQGVAILLLSTTQTVPLTTHYLASDALRSAEGGDTILAGATQQIGDVNLAYAVAAFLLIAAVVHALAATVLRKRYEQGLAQGVNTTRWVGYALSGGVIIVTIGLLVGVRDLASLIMLFSLAALVSLLGLAGDVYKQKTRQPGWLVCYLSVFAGLVAWIVLTTYLISGALLGSTVSGYVYAAFAAVLLLLVGFALLVYKQHRGVGKWKDYLYGERQHLVLSFVAKTALAWLVFAAVLSP